MNRVQQVALDELDAIEEALAAARVPRPFPAAGHAVTWVKVALDLLTTATSELAEARAALAAAEAAAAIPAPREPFAGLAAVAAKAAPAVVPPERRAAIDRVQSRQDRVGCPTPEKRASYNVADLEELKLANRRRKTGDQLYPCDCGWHHLGTPHRLRVQQTPPADGPFTWAIHRRQVALLTGAGDIHAVGVVVRYEADPTVVVECADGRRVPWRADLARAINDQQEEAS